MKLLITHFINRAHPSTGLLGLIFITQSYVKGERVYHPGFATYRMLTENQITEQVKSGFLVRLDTAIPAIPDKYLWMDTKGGVWYASKTDPYGEIVNNKPLYKPEGYSVPSSLTQTRFDTTDLVLNTFGQNKLPVTTYYEVPSTSRQRVN